MPMIQTKFFNRLIAVGAVPLKNRPKQLLAAAMPAPLLGEIASP